MILKAMKSDCAVFHGDLTEFEFHSSSVIPPNYVYTPEGNVCRLLMEENGEKHLLPIVPHEEQAVRYYLNAPTPGDAIAICVLKTYVDGKPLLICFHGGYLMTDDGKTIERLY